MDRLNQEEVLRNLDRRVGRIEQILPTLATREELRAEVARLATREELRKAIEPLATREELRAEGERTRAHFNAVAERLEEQLRLVAEAVLALTRRFDAFKAETEARFADVEQRLTRLEARYAGR